MTCRSLPIAFACAMAGAVFALCTPAWAAEAGPQSSACQQALTALQVRESSLTAPSAASQANARVSGDAQWRSLRAQAAKACLGAESDQPAPLPHSAIAPIQVAPVLVPPISATPALRAPTAVLPAPPPIRAPSPTVTSCDPGGCWTSDGARVPRVGRNPPDPVGRCNLQGNVVVCL
jgi:hypothetical protein